MRMLKFFFVILTTRKEVEKLNVFKQQTNKQTKKRLQFSLV